MNLTRLIAAAAVIVAMVGAAACSNPSIVHVDRRDLAEAHISTVYVPRFEGSPEFVEESTDMFVSALETETSVRVVQGDSLRREGPDILAGGNIDSTSDAIAAAKRAGAQAVILGKVTSYKSGATLNGFATVRIIDTQTGRVLASFHRPSGDLVAWSSHQAVLDAVKRTAEDTAAALR
jgi:curli biogenesis system outer membrane secretion channel CsgG